ncbi:MAG: efflux RND transporter periplasmic adaptor subunit [Chloroflexi bacterium]|nr:efflux RND transporter periplasmic adaptor subunit [Chloroflexota bacterium]
MRRKWWILSGAAVVLLLAAIAVSRFAAMSGQAAGEWQTQPARRGDLQVSSSATGVTRARQSALLTWRASGVVASAVQTGERVSRGQAIAALEAASLSPQVLLAQAEAISAQRALEDLQLSSKQRALAQQAVEDAEQALEDALDPSTASARAQAAAANAQKELENAQRTLAILQAAPSEQALAQARASMLLAQNVYEDTQRNVERIQKRLKKEEEDYKFFESRELYARILEGLEQKLLQDRLAYEDTVERYEALLQPPDAEDVLAAQANVLAWQARLAEAQLDWQRAQAGPTPGELAVLQARLDDARREWERLKGGPDAGDIAAAEARLTAAQAAMAQAGLSVPFDGVITQAASRPGDIVAAGDLAFRLDDLSHLLVDTQVSEIDINRIQPGMPVILVFDSIPGKEYQGRVVEAARAGVQVGNAVSFNVVIEALDADDLVKPGMTVEVSFVLEQIHDALLVPSRALRILDGRRVVYVLKDGAPVPVAATIGVIAQAEAQTLSGDLQAGDLIVLNPPAR